MGWYGSRCGYNAYHYGAGYYACCELFYDDFDRADSATVGNGWDERGTPGAWEIDGNRLKLSGTGSGVFCIHSISAGPPDHAVEADVMFKIVGQVAGIVTRYNAASDACYLLLEINLDATDCAALKLWNNKTCESSALLLAQAAVSNITLDEWHHLKLCYRTFGDQNEAQVYGTLTTAAGQRITLAATTTMPEADPTAYNYVGVYGAPGPDPIYFNDFECDAQEDDVYECCTYCYYDTPYDCILGEDTFTRGDSPNLGCQWSDCANGAIDGNEARFTSDNTFCQFDYITSIPAWAIVIRVKGADDGDEAHGVVAIEDSDNYLFAKLTIDDTCGSLKLYQRSGGTNTQLGSTVAVQTAVPDQWHTMRVCWDGTHLWAHVTTASGEDRWYRQEAQIDASALAALGGIGVGNVTTEVRFDDFRLEYMVNVFSQIKYYDDCEPCRPGDPALSCVIHADNFTRADSDDLGCLWEEVSGDHDINTNRLVTAAAGIAISRVPHGYGDSEAYITVNITAPANGDTARVVFDYGDVDNYHYLSITWGATGVGNADGTFQLYRRASGSDTALMLAAVTIPGLNAGDQASVILCWYGSYAEATVNGASGSASTTGHGGDRAGLGGGSVSVAFANWSFEYLYGTAGTEDCGRCITLDECSLCEESQAPSEMIVRLPAPIVLAPSEDATNTCTADDDCPQWIGRVFVTTFSTENPTPYTWCRWAGGYTEEDACTNEPLAAIDLAYEVHVYVARRSSTHITIKVIFRNRTSLFENPVCCQALEYLLEVEADENTDLACLEFENLEIPFHRIDEHLLGDTEAANFMCGFGFASCCEYVSYPASVFLTAA